MISSGQTSRNHISCLYQRLNPNKFWWLLENRGLLERLCRRFGFWLYQNNDVNNIFLTIVVSQCSEAFSTSTQRTTYLDPRAMYLPLFAHWILGPGKDDLTFHHIMVSSPVLMVLCIKHGNILYCIMRWLSFGICIEFLCFIWHIWRKNEFLHQKGGFSVE